MLLEDALWPTKTTPPLLVIEHDLSRSTIPLLRRLVADGLNTTSTKGKGYTYQNVILATFLHPPKVFVRDLSLASGKEAKLKIIYRTERVFEDNYGEKDDFRVKLDAINEFRVQWSNALQECKPNDGSLLLVIDSLDAMVLDVGVRHAFMFLQDAMEVVKGHRGPGRVIVSVSSTSVINDQNESSIIDQVLSISLTPSLTHIRLYPPNLFTHLSKAFLLPLPPRTAESKFYSVFGPFTNRARREAEKLWYAELDGRESRGIPTMSSNNGSGGGGGGLETARKETVMEVVVRAVGLRKSVERSLEGWIDGLGPCTLEGLPNLSECFEFTGSALPVVSSDTKNATDPSALGLPFNLTLTEEQVASRAQVPLPYAHTGEGHGTDKSGGTAVSTIYYDPDSADDLDEEDPDEDLDL